MNLARQGPPWLWCHPEWDLKAEPAQSSPKPKVQEIQATGQWGTDRHSAKEHQ